MSEYLLGFSTVIGTSALSSYFTSKNTSTDWYSCIKPSITPPSSVFPVVWSFLYLLIAIAFSLAIKERNNLVISLFLINFALNILWCYFYFYKKQIKLALSTILILNISTIMIMINTDNPTIRKLLVPYLLWVSFATILNAKTLEKVEDCENLKEN
jgi:tryptophan-rich sensory protein